MGWRPLLARQQEALDPVLCAQMGGTVRLHRSGSSAWLWVWDSFSSVKEGSAMGCSETCDVECVSWQS